LPFRHIASQQYEQEQKRFRYSDVSHLYFRLEFWTDSHREVEDRMHIVENQGAGMPAVFIFPWHHVPEAAAEKGKITPHCRGLRRPALSQIRW
jgi:hypothetical protein